MDSKEKTDICAPKEACPDNKQDVNKCNKCNLKFSNNNELKKHVELDRNSRGRICNKCDMKFTETDMAEWLLVQKNMKIRIV